MGTDLTTTNVFLGVMAAVSLLEAVAVLGVFAAAFMVFRRLMQVINAIEERQVAPAVTRVNAILDDVKGVTSTMKREADRVDRVVRTAADTLDRWRAGSTS
jgi:hypothetical protein